MYSLADLAIVTEGRTIPNVFSRQQGEADTLALVLPGYNYSTEMPLLYYPRKLLLDGGCTDVLQVDYAYNRIPGFTDLPVQTRYARLDEDVTAALETALAQRTYQRLVLVGKSLGTAAMGLLLRRAVNLPPIHCVWLTPLLTESKLCKAISAFRPPSLFAIGTADRYYQPDTLAELCALTGGTSVVIEDADHSLEVTGEVERSLVGLKQVVLAIKQFIG